MGIIIKQSLKGSIWSYLGLVVGYINVGLIMPTFFMTDQIGLVQLFVAITTIFTNFSSLGFGSVINRLFPEFRNPNEKHHGFFGILVLVALAGFFISLAAFFFLKPIIIEANTEKSPLLVEYFFLLVPIFFFRIFFKLFDGYNRVLRDAVTGTFWNDFIHKIVNLLLIILYSVEVINFRQFMYGYTLSLSLPAFPLLVAFIRKGEFYLKPDFGFLKRPLIREMITVAAFGLINGLSGALTQNIDKLLINQYLSLDQVGIFSVCALFATVIMIPSRSIAKISVGIIAEAWKRNDKAHIQEIFSKASLNQTIIGALIFSGIIVNLDHIFTILPDVYRQGKWVLILYALGTLIRVSITTGATIIMTSKYYRTLTYIILLQIIVSVSLHILFIPIFGIKGAALSVLLTYTFATLVVAFFLKLKTGLFCYSFKHVWILLIAGISVLVSLLMPGTGMLILDILLKSGVVSLVYIILILSFHLSVDMNRLFKKTIKTFRNSLKNKFNLL